ncbi:translation initiation factor IF-2 [Drosophila gunungcola]|nr:translation initiation factor IF-2 [Drosophila gunungcola]
MQQLLVIVSLGLLASVAAKPALDQALFSAGSPFGFYPGSAAPIAAYTGAPFAAAPFANPLGASPLSAVSSSQRLDYFNQFNAAFAPTAPARILAAAPFASAGARLIQPTRLIAPGGPAPYFF